MASKPIQSSRMELYEPAISKPNPLRIVKRPKARPNGSPMRRTPLIGRSSIILPDSPPDPPEKSLTVHKLRKKRPTVLEVADEGHTGSVILAMVQQTASPSRETLEDLDKTPRPRQKDSKVINIGNYVKDELFRGSSDSELSLSLYNEPSTPSRNEFPALVNTPTNPGLKSSESSSSLYSDVGTVGTITPKRQLSRSRRFLKKAIGGLDGARSKSMHLLRTDSFTKDCKDPSVGSRKSHKATLSSCSNGFRSVSSNSSSDYDLTSRATYERDPISSSHGSPESMIATTGTFGHAPIELLIPKISVLQGGHNIADGDENTVWVAIEVTGTYMKTKEQQLSMGQEHDYHHSFMSSTHRQGSAAAERIRSLPQIPAKHTTDAIEQDYLYELRVHIRTSDGCNVESIVGDTEEPRTIKDQQSELLIAKIRFADNFTRTPSPGHSRQSSESLIAELESRLVQCATDFLDITLTYKHSAFGFLDHMVPDGSSTIVHQNTKLVTSARAVIRRYDSLAAWSPRAPDYGGPLSELIKTHFAGDKAESIMQRISSRSPPHDNMSAWLQRHHSWNSSEGTITPGLPQSDTSSSLSPIAMKDKLSEVKPPVPVKPLHLHPFSSKTTSEYSTSPTSSRELDPARKIWSEMRRSSKGTRPSCSIKTLTDGFSADDGYMDLERQRISEQAVRNKRSLGADTLRSIVRENDRDREGDGDGVQSGRIGGWVNWGPPWW